MNTKNLEEDYIVKTAQNQVARTLVLRGFNIDNIDIYTRLSTYIQSSFTYS